MTVAALSKGHPTLRLYHIDPLDGGRYEPTFQNRPARAYLTLCCNNSGMIPGPVDGLTVRLPF